jgi:hypothetical protein
MRHEHRSPKTDDIFKLRLMLPKFKEYDSDENGVTIQEAQQGQKRNSEEISCEAGIYLFMYMYLYDNKNNYFTFDYLTFKKYYLYVFIAINWL